jgi:hypothetical protein
LQPFIWQGAVWPEQTLAWLASLPNKQPEGVSVVSFPLKTPFARFGFWENSKQATAWPVFLLHK